MLDINVKELVDEAGKVLPGVLDGLVDKLFENLKGQIITVTIVENELQIKIK